MYALEARRIPRAVTPNSEGGQGVLALKHTISTRMYCAIGKWKLDCVVLCEIICEMQDAQLFMAISSPNAREIDCVSCGSLFQMYWYLAVAANTNYYPENVKETLRVSLFTGVGLTV
jgi:hypothetical protein